MSTGPEQLAARLLARHRDARERHRQRAQELLALVRREVAQAGRRGLVRRAWLIGSLAAGTFGDASDVDLVVEGLAVEELGPLWGELVERLGVDVDLLRLEELPERFRARVERDGTPLDVG